MTELLLRAVNLQMFTEGGDAGAEGTAPQAETTSSGSSRRNSGNKKGELADVIYGKQETTEETGTTGSAAESKETHVTTTSDTLEDKRKAFEALIDGEYKEEFTKRTQEIINRRFKDMKNLEAHNEATQPILDMLYQKYKITDGDLKKLKDAIDTDDTYWEEGAEAAGLTVEQYKAVQKIERENAELRKAQERAIGQQQMDAKLSNWWRQGEELKAIYPDFDLSAESKNRDFLQLLEAGVPVKHAYETMHIDELIQGAAIVAAQQAEQRTVANIKNRASRPAENGTSSQGAATIKSDVASLTKADRAEIARRVARGETIKF